MKTQTAKLNHFKMAPRKVRLVVDLIKGLPVNEAEAQLIVSKKRASGQIAKLLRSAVANAKNTKEMNPDKLFIKEAWVDEGPMLKRFMPRAMGRAGSIHKKSSHVTLVLAESQKLKGPRFKTERVLPKKEAEQEKKEISASAKVKKDSEKPKVAEREINKASAAPGFMKKVFRRKSI
jgi:large subunit ribosomal protein L22